MRSQVARHVLRRLPAARGVATSHLASATPRPTLRPYPVGYRVARIVQRRSFFKLFQKPPRNLKPIDVEPGYETLLAYQAGENYGLRPPPLTDLEEAWKRFFTYKARHNRVVNSTQALCARRVLEYLCRVDIAGSVNLSLEDLHLAIKCLEKPPRDDPNHHLALSRALFSELTRREMNISPSHFHKTTLEHRPGMSHADSKYLHHFLAALSQYGAAVEAKEIFLKILANSKQRDYVKFNPRHSMIPIMEGLAKEGNEQGLREVVRKVVSSDTPYDVGIQKVMVDFFAQRNDFYQTNFWFAKALGKGLHPRPQTYYEILLFALRNDKKEWATEIYKDLIAQLESGSLAEFKACWDVAFQYAFLLFEKGPDEMESLFEVAFEQTKHKKNPDSQPNILSINLLLRCAIDTDNPYMAERFIALSKKLEFEPNLMTYQLQIEYRLRAKDLNGAFVAFQELRHLEISVNDNEFPVLNKLIRSLCESSRPDYEKILEVTSYLEQRHVTLEPETVVSICMAFLKNDETYEVIDTLSLHTAYYSFAEREMVRKSFVNYCLDKNNSTARVWDAYALLRQFFPELELEDRVAVMDVFFERRRPDMACHIFGHMRSHDNPRYRPTLETYVRCLEGIGECRDTKGLGMVHNMMKMDTSIQVNTLLYNALMIGYTACDMSHRALDFWKEITTSPEGPSYATLEIVFRTYEVQPYGDAPAKELWAKLLSMEVDIPENVYAAYATTLAAHSHVEDVKVLLGDHDAVIGARPAYSTFAYVYNAFPAQEMKDDLESWIKHEFPHLWKPLTLWRRRKRDEDQLLQFNVTRPWKA
ncbi:complex I intermediate-associated protein [Xylaria nigripes]|nr:complex I intermediate-associated protein [Xylaria nigripes]